MIYTCVHKLHKYRRACVCAKDEREVKRNREKKEEKKTRVEREKKKKKNSKYIHILNPSLNIPVPVVHVSSIWTLLHNPPRVTFSPLSHIFMRSVCTSLSVRVYV